MSSVQQQISVPDLGFFQVSSANRDNVSKFEVVGKSFTYNKNKRGPKMNSCGTPQVNGREIES